MAVDVSTTPRSKRIVYLNRRVAFIEPDRINVRPALAAALFPLFGLLWASLRSCRYVLWLDTLPFAVSLLLLVVAIVSIPLAGIGFVYTVAGANVVFEREKQSGVWQQGFLGMGVGTIELVPFWKIDQIRIEEVTRERQRGEVQDLAQLEIVIVKESGKRLRVGDIIVPRSMVREGLADVREVASAIAEMTGQAAGRARRRAHAPQPARRIRRRPPTGRRFVTEAPTPARQCLRRRQPARLDRPARVQRRGAPARRPRTRDHASWARRRSPAEIVVATTAAATARPTSSASAAASFRNASPSAWCSIRSNMRKGRCDPGTGARWRGRRYVFFMDADLATPPEEALRLLERLDAGAPVAIGSRIQPDGSDMRASQPTQPSHGRASVHDDAKDHARPAGHR